MQKQCCNVVIMMKFDEWGKSNIFFAILLLLCLGISSSTAWHFPSKLRPPPPPKKNKIKIEGHTSLFLHPDVENPSYAHLCCTISCCFTIFNFCSVRTIFIGVNRWSMLLLAHLIELWTGWRHTCSAAATKLLDFEWHFLFLVIISPPEQWSLQ